MPPPMLSANLRVIQGVRLADSTSAWDISIDYPPDSPHGVISSVTPHDSPTGTHTAECPLVLPALTHPHIHLDKAFIHNAPRYANLLPCTGSFQEALSFTTKAKKQFTRADLLERGEWLLAESVSSGVTAMRAFVEVDHSVKWICLEAAVALKSQWRDSCEIQIACFAQDPIFSSKYGEENMHYIDEALQRYPQIDVIGTTPYVEFSIEAAKANIDWAIDCALQFDKHLDFHIDYNLDPSKGVLVIYVLQGLQRRGWTTRSTRKRVMLGHCTRLTLAPVNVWTEISNLIHEHDLPVSFVGLPTSDVYMASPQGHDNSNGKPRGTLHIPDLIRQHRLDAVMGVNNVGNAFTPWGSADPLFLACLGVGIYQAGTRGDADLLYECVSTRARAAIGLSPISQGLGVHKGAQPDFLLFRDRDETGCGVSRVRASVAEVVWDPPARISRDVVIDGRVKQSGSGGSDGDSMYRFA
ncbi:uncharacterized protein N7459_007003 [Penicillium hispanicum]|uniref:uncharacterized protein n=1 Tax=Penicillium hispanicum TaxID=1080232 RepID=UPI002541C078|nr:uncharacterized protein N7459_007003 [Penicillium hispanicum]KAJ5578039.1 hypothetical protein N7459_007003 [Penicillium hispanicum]